MKISLRKYRNVWCQDRKAKVYYARSCIQTKRCETQGKYDFRILQQNLYGIHLAAAHVEFKLSRIFERRADWHASTLKVSRWLLGLSCWRCLLLHPDKVISVQKSAVITRVAVAKDTALTLGLNRWRFLSWFLHNFSIWQTICSFHSNRLASLYLLCPVLRSNSNIALRVWVHSLPKLKPYYEARLRLSDHKF